MATVELASGLKALGLGLIVVAAVIYGVGGGVESNPTVAIPGALILLAGLILHIRGRQHMAKDGAASVLEDSRPDVLYLRTFRADSSTMRQALHQGLTSEEEQLADVLRPFGDLVAIGRPGEGLQPSGAARQYASDSQWQGVVTRRLADAPLVVVRAGVGVGLLWEFEHIIRHVDPRKVIVWIMNLKKGEYATFCTQVNERLSIALPQIPPFGYLAAMLNLRNNPSKVAPGFIRFSPAWQPSFEPLPTVWMQLGYNDLRRAFSLALRPVFEERGVQWRALGRLWRGR